jgi:hypothetical protein
MCNEVERGRYSKEKKRRKEGKKECMLRARKREGTKVNGFRLAADSNLRLISIVDACWMEPPLTHPTSAGSQSC